MCSTECTRASRHIVVTGGCGYIGSHTLLSLLTSADCEYSVTVLDNLSNASVKVLDRIRELVLRPRRDATSDEKTVGDGGRSAEDEYARRVCLVEGDIRVMEDVEKAFSGRKVDAVIHFAGLKAVGTMRRYSLSLSLSFSLSLSLVRGVA